MRGLITVRHEPRLSSLLGVSVFRQRNTGTHPNTHCCHAVLDVLFICWIPAQSRFSTGAESPTKYAASFLRTHSPVPKPHTRFVPAGPSAPRPSPRPSSWLGLFSVSFPPLLPAFPRQIFPSFIPACFSVLRLVFSLGFCLYFLFLSLSPHFCLYLSFLFFSSAFPSRDYPLRVFAPRRGADWQRGSPRLTSLFHLPPAPAPHPAPPLLHAQGPSSARGKPELFIQARHTP